MSGTCAAGAVTLLVAMFLPWYSLRGGDVARFFLAGAAPPTGDAWDALARLRWLLFGTVLAGVTPMLLSVTGQPAAARRAGRLAAALALAMTVLVIARLINRPGADQYSEVEYGAFVGLAATLSIAGSGSVGLWLGRAVAADAEHAIAPAVSRGEPSRGGRALRRSQLTLLVGVVALGCFIHFVGLGTSSWNVDEYVYGSVGYSFLHGDFNAVPGPHPYLGAYLLGFVPSVTGSVTPMAVRVAPAAAGVATGVVLLVFAHRLAGYRAAVIAAAAWLLLPHATVMGGAALTAIRVERFGLLDVFMELFIALALYAGWRWSEEGAWGWALATGLFAGFAVSSKLVGALVLLPLASLLILNPERHRRRIVQFIAIAVVAVSTFWLSFAPVLPNAPERLDAMLDLGGVHEAAGHPSIIAGRVYLRAPWWGDAWFMFAGMGVLTALALCASAVAGFAVVERRVAIYLTIAVVVPAVALAGFYPIALPHYYILWLAPLTLLAALALDALLRSGARGVVVALALALPLAIAAMTTVIDVTLLKPRDYRAAASVLERRHLDRGSVAVLGYGPVLCAYLPAAQVTSQATSRSDVIVIDPITERRLDPFNVRDFLTRHRGDYVGSRIDRLRLYIRRASARTNAATGPQRQGIGCYRQ
jgi:Dolichyl-phosphate-mannose-protein mannosyltransferase